MTDSTYQGAAGTATVPWHPIAETFLLVLAAQLVGMTVPLGWRLLALAVLGGAAMWSAGTRPRGAVMLAWGVFATSWVLFALLRAVADDLGPAPLVDYAAVADRVIGLGVLPTHRLQGWWYTPGTPRWWDSAMLAVYGWHFPALILTGGAVWLLHRPSLPRLLYAGAATHLAALPLHVAMPTAPPWLAGAWGAIPTVYRQLYEAAAGISPDAYRIGMHASGNDVAAMPSLHMAWAWLTVLAFWRMHIVARACGVVYALAVAWATVYGGEHYVVDLLAGMALAHGAWWAVGRWQRRA